METIEFADLPELVYLNIFKYLDIQSLANFGRTSRKSYIASRVCRQQRKKQVATKAKELFQLPGHSTDEDLLNMVYHLNKYTCYDLKNIEDIRFTGVRGDSHGIWNFINIRIKKGVSTIILEYWNNIKIIEERRYYEERHCENGPAVKQWYTNGNKRYEAWYRGGRYRRDDGPAIRAWSCD
jgi:hypothetical protein